MEPPLMSTSRGGGRAPPVPPIRREPTPQKDEDAEMHDDQAQGYEEDTEEHQGDYTEQDADQYGATLDEDDNNGWGTRTQQENQYFNSYANIAIHEEMIKDFNRTYSYKKAIFDHAADFKDKVVLDVGCGTGILSIFCAKAGAKQVYGIEASGIAEVATQVVEANKLSDRVTIINGLVEEVTLPEQVDIIVSEWMGYFLVYEAMMNAVIFARDKWLKPGGMLFPAEARLFISPFSDEEYYTAKVDFWKNVYDIDMSPLIPMAKATAFYGAAVDSLKPENSISAGILVKSFDCATVTPGDLEDIFNKLDFEFTRSCDWHGFVGYFDVIFRNSARTEDDPNAVILSTAPEAGYTHWHQTVFMFEDPIPVEKGQRAKGHISVRPHPNAPRHLAISFAASTPTHSIAKSYDF